MIEIDKAETMRLIERARFLMNVFSAQLIAANQNEPALTRPCAEAGLHVQNRFLAERAK